MPLSAGTGLGPYKVLALLGAGGWGRPRPGLRFPKNRRLRLRRERAAFIKAQIGGVERRNRRVSQRARWTASVTGGVLRTAIA